MARLPRRGDIGNMFAVGVLAEWHPRDSEDAGEQVVQLVAGDGSYSGGTTETKKLDDLYSRETEIVADSDVLQHSDTMLEEGGEEGVGLGKYNGGSWTKMVMVVKNHDERDRDSNRVSTVEPSLRAYDARCRGLSLIQPPE